MGSGEISGATVMIQDALSRYVKQQGNGSAGGATVFFSEALEAFRHSGREHCVEIGGTTVVFWSDNGDADDLLMAAMSALSDHWQDRSTPEARRLCERVSSAGRWPPANMYAGLEGRFYAVGLAKTSGQTTVKFFIVDKLSHLAGNIRDFWEDLRIEPSDGGPAPSVIGLLRETVPGGRLDLAPANLISEILYALLSGGGFPPSLLSAVLGRLRSDGDLTENRVAALKGVIARRERLGGAWLRSPVMLKPNFPDQAYQLGRLACRIDAVDPKLKTDAFQTGSVFRSWLANGPRLSLRTSYLMLLSLPVLQKTEKDIPQGVRIREAIKTLWLECFKRRPSLSNPEDQARFALGYYHQSAARDPAGA